MTRERLSLRAGLTLALGILTLALTSCLPEKINAEKSILQRVTALITTCEALKSDLNQKGCVPYSSDYLNLPGVPVILTINGLPQIIPTGPDGTQTVMFQANSGDPINAICPSSVDMGSFVFTLEDQQSLDSRPKTPAFEVDCVYKNTGKVPPPWQNQSASISGRR